MPQHDHDEKAPGVQDHPDGGRLVAESGGSVAELVYEMDGDRMVVLHAGVPEEIGGRGIGGQLVRAAIEKAAQGGFTIVPLCPFTRRWLRKNPDAARAVNVDWGAVRRLRT